MAKNGSNNPSSSEEEESVSTSSDEELAVGKKSTAKRKYYRPEDDEIFEMEDDDSSSLEKSEELVANQPRQKASHGKRRKRSDEDSDADSRPASSTSYDEDEAALKQALALSLASTPVEEGVDLPSGRTMSSRASLDETRKRYDPEENALQQALAASMTETEGVLDSMRVSDANEPSSSAKPSTEHATRARGERLSSPPIAIDARDSKGASRSKTRKKSSKLSFPAPSIEMVKQAFNMLDPTGSGAVNPYALREVASKLLHKDLDDDQLQAMMEFASDMTSSEGGIPGVVDAEGFCRLVARFSSNEGVDK